jgi:hypothetical protein
LAEVTCSATQPLGSISLKKGLVTSPADCPPPGVSVEHATNVGDNTASSSVKQAVRRTGRVGVWFSWLIDHLYRVAPQADPQARMILAQILFYFPALRWSAFQVR